MSPIVSAVSVISNLQLDVNHAVLTFKVLGPAPLIEEFFGVRSSSPSSRPVRVDGLWNNVCFELFVKPHGDQSKYFEFNFSREGHWNLFEFQDYRSGKSEFPVSIEPTVETFLRGHDLFIFKAVIPRYPPIFTRTMKVGMTLILKSKMHTEFFALKHCGEKPDFHLSESFIYDSIWN